MVKCTTRNWFIVKVEYDLKDKELHKEFRRCMFSRKIKSGIYKFKSKDSEDEMTYEIEDGIYARSYGVVNGRRIRIEV